MPAFGRGRSAAPQQPAWRHALAGALLALAANSALAGLPRVAVLPFDFINSTGLALRPDEQGRLERLPRQVGRALSASGLVRVINVDAGDASARQILSGQSLYNCNGCEAQLGKALGADLVLAGWVQKVSDLILNMNAKVVSTATGQVVAFGWVDLRGNTDLSWSRAVSYLMENILVPELKKALACAPPAASARSTAGSRASPGLSRPGSRL